MGEDQIQKLRLRLAKAGGKGCRGYGAELRGDVRTAARQWSAEGRSRRELAEKLGLSVATLARWTEAARATVRAVDVVDVVPVRPGLAVVLPSGVRIEGITLAEATELAQRLR